MHTVITSININPPIIISMLNIISNKKDLFFFYLRNIFLAITQKITKYIKATIELVNTIKLVIIRLDICILIICTLSLID